MFSSGIFFRCIHFQRGNVYGNRPHSAVERNAGEELLVRLVSILKPRRIVAVGNDSARALMKIFSKPEINHVRHPSHGGERVFREQVASLYGSRVSSSRLFPDYLYLRVNLEFLKKSFYNRDVEVLQRADNAIVPACSGIY